MGSVSLPGACIWMTGRGGAGKSTLTDALVPMLVASGRTVTVLDVVPELRKLPCERTSRGKLIRKAFVAREVARHGGIAICVTISSKRQIRDEVRAMIGPESFVEVFVDVPIEVSRRRKADRPKKVALTKRLRRSVRGFARRWGLARGRSFDEPLDPDVTVDSVSEKPEVGARRIIEVMVERGFLSADSAPI